MAVRKSFFGNEKLFFENLLTNSSLCGIILSVNGTNRLLGICVMAAQQTLTLYVGVRISHPQPGKKSRVSGFFVFHRADGVMSCAIWFPFCL